MACDSGCGCDRCGMIGIGSFPWVGDLIPDISVRVPMWAGAARTAVSGTDGEVGGAPWQPPVEWYTSSTGFVPDYRIPAVDIGRPRDPWPHPPPAPATPLWPLVPGRLRPCHVFGATIPLPSFQDVDIVTQICFALEYGDTGWPDTDCCPPALNLTVTCDPPTLAECLTMSLRVPEHDFDSTVDVTATSPAQYDRQIFGAGMAVLIENIDIARWAICLAQSWSSEVPAVALPSGLSLLDRINEILTVGSDGSFPMNVTYVTDSADGANMWAYCDWQVPSDGVGVIISISDQWWIDRVVRWRHGGDSAFCAATQIAATILHELVHIAGDVAYDKCQLEQPTTLHEPTPSPRQTCPDTVLYPCWDEARMVETIFIWAMAKRFPCLGATPEGTCMPEDRFFAYSAPTQDQLLGTC